MSNTGEYYDHLTYPATGAAGSSAAMRAELDAIEAGLNKLPAMAANGGKMVKVAASADNLEVSSVISDDGTDATIAGDLIVSGTQIGQNGTQKHIIPAVASDTLALLAAAQALTNKTIVAASNTITTSASGNLAATELNAALAELQSDIDNRQPLDATLTALAGLSATAGILEQTGADTFTKRTIGTGANNLVALDGTSKLPAVDGSQLTGVVATVTDGDKGDLTVSGSGATYTLDLTAITGKAAETAPAVGDLLLLDDVSEGALNSITLEDLLKVLNGLTEDTAPDVTADFSLTYDASAGGVKKVLLGRAAAPYQPASVTASGTTAIEFTGIPAWARKLTLFWRALSTNGTVDARVQLGDSGGYETSGYGGYISRIGNTGGVNTANSSGFLITDTTAATSAHHGSLELKTFDSTNTVWEADGVSNANASGFGSVFAGDKTLSAALDRLRVYVDGVQTIDGGVFGLLVE